MTGRNAVPILVPWLLAVLALGPPASGQDRRGGLRDPEAVDVRPRPMDRIPPGTVIGEAAPKGWTDLILFATPRLGVGDVDEVSQSAASYSRMFLFTILANVRGETVDGRPSYVLDKVAIGIALNIQGRNIIADGEDTFGADLGIIGRHVLAENEKILASDFRQVARTSTMIVFDANMFVRRDQKHRAMVLRHVILASPDTGRVSTFVWLLGPDAGGGYALADKGLQKLPPALREDRVLSVDGRKFTFGIPSADAFALAKIPRGTALGFSEALKAVAATKPFTPQSARRLEAELLARYVPVVGREQVAGKARE